MTVTGFETVKLNNKNAFLLKNLDTGHEKNKILTGFYV